MKPTAETIRDILVKVYHNHLTVETAKKLLEAEIDIFHENCRPKVEGAYSERVPDDDAIENKAAKLFLSGNTEGDNLRNIAGWMRSTLLPILESQARTIEALEENVRILKEEREWISVEDRLPVKDGNSTIYCLVNNSYNREVAVHPFNEHHICWDTQDGDDYFTDAKGGKITHWMPIPEAPELKSKSQKAS